MTGEGGRQVPEVEAAFTALLKKFSIGAKGGIAPETIAENISRTGGEFVFEDPQKLAERLATWHEYISPVKRKQILEQWFAEKGVEVPREVIDLAGIKSSDITRREEEERRKKEEEEKKKAKFAVDTETGLIRQAKEGEVALTMAEAIEISDRIKKEIEAKAGKAKRGVFTLDKDGNLQVVEGETLTAEDVAVMNAVGKAQEAGDKRSALDILEEEVKRFALIEGFRGGGKKESTLLDDAERLKTLKEIFGTDQETKELLTGIYNRLGALGTGPQESEEVKGLRADVTKLREQLEQKEKERLEDTIRDLRNELVDTRAEFKKNLDEAKGKNEYGIMSEGIGLVDKRLGAIEGILQGIFSKRPPPLPEAEKKLLTGAISEEAKAEAELAKLEEKVFFSGQQIGS